MFQLFGKYRDMALAVKNPCHLNMAACLIKLKRYDEAIAQCGIVRINIWCYISVNSVIKCHCTFFLSFIGKTPQQRGITILVSVHSFKNEDKNIEFSPSKVAM